VDPRHRLAELPAVSAPAPARELALARRDTVLRFAFGVTFAFVICEALNWRPTALAPVLTGVLLANIPMRPPLKLCLVIIASMVLASAIVLVVSLLLRVTPSALWVAVGILFFATFLAMLRGAPGLPCMLMLICLAAIPVVAIASPAHVALLPQMLDKSIVIAVLVTLAMHALLPRTLPPEPPPAPAKLPEPVAIAFAATCVVMPVMLVFLLYSPTSALPVMIATVLLTSHFDPTHSKRDAWVRVVANAGGGSLGAAAHWLLLANASLTMLALISFLLAYSVALLMVKRTWKVSTLVLANNGCFVIFSSAIAQGPSSAGVALERVIYFSLAGLFVTVAMYVAWGFFDRTRSQAQPA
jgi:hypothetical protein